MLDKLNHDEVDIKILHSGVGSITENDILLAGASGAICVGFNVKPEGKAKAEAVRQHVEIRTYKIIYELVEDIEAAMKGLLKPKFEDQYIGKVEIRAVYKLTKAGIVAGCHVTDGKVVRGAVCKVTRGDEMVHKGTIESLRNVKQDAKEMVAGQDCGVRFVDWDDFKQGDVIEAFERVQIG